MTNYALTNYLLVSSKNKKYLIILFFAENKSLLHFYVLFGDHQKRFENKFLQKQAKFQYSIYEYVTGVRCHCQKKTPGTWLTPLDQDISWYLYFPFAYKKK